MRSFLPQDQDSDMVTAMIIAIPVPSMVVDVSTGGCSGIDIVAATGPTETAVDADELP